MTSQPAKKIRNGLIRDVLDETPIALKRNQWEYSARIQSTPPGVNVSYLN